MSMVEELKMVREALFSMIVEEKSNTFEAQEAYAKLGSIIEQIEKAEPVAWYIRYRDRNYKGEWGGWRDMFRKITTSTNAVQRQRMLEDYPGDEKYLVPLFTAPTPDEITKLREQLAICQQTWLSPETYQALMNERSETLKKLADAQSKITELQEEVSYWKAEFDNAMNNIT